MNNRGCWTEKSEVDSHDWDRPLSNAIISLFNPKRVVDIGCGNGGYTRNFIDHGIQCQGYDGSPLTLQITEGLCWIMDFSEPVNVGRFDLVLSLEVGEHIPLQYEGIFLDNLIRAASKDIVMSWAVEGQSGYGHVNCRENYYIIGKMQERNFHIDYELTKALRDKSTFPWFKNTLMVFSWK